MFTESHKKIHYCRTLVDCLFYSAWKLKIVYKISNLLNASLQDPLIFSHKNFQVAGQIDHPFGAPSPKQQMPQEAKIDEEMGTDECSTIGLIGLLQAHWKAVHDGFEEGFAALIQKI